MDALVVGNGSSRKDLPTGWQKDYVTIGVNYCGFQPTYYVCVDSALLLHHRKEVAEFVEGAEEAFINQQYVKYWKYLGDKVVPIGRYNTERTGRMGWHSSVIIPALLVAYKMGFEKVGLAGCDLEKEWKHYRDDYPRPTDPEMKERGNIIRKGLYAIRERFETDGRNVYNVCPSSPLDIFERRELPI